MRGRVCFLFVAVVLVACGDDQGVPPHVTSSLVKAPVSLTQVVEIGCTACGSDDQLSILSLDADRDGRVYVLDRFEPFVRIFDRDGGLIRSFGTLGEGPGELVQPLYIYAGSTGRVYVLDSRGRRLIRYADDGRWEQEWKLPHFPYAPVLDSQARRLIFVSQHEALTRGESAIYAYDLENASLARLVDFEGDYPTNDDGDASIYYPIAVDPHCGVAVGEHGPAYRVRMFDAAGQESRSYSLELLRVAKSEEELARERAQIARERIRFTPDPLKLHYYAWALSFDDAGRLWVRAGRSDTRRTYFDVFEGGRYLGVVQAPPGIAERERYSIRNGRLVAKYKNDVDEDVVRVFRVTPADD